MNNKEYNKIAPVALFVYNRLKNTKEVLEALQKNYLAKKTDLFIFSDFYKTESHKKDVLNVRKYIKNIRGFKTVNIIERRENYYIEKNIIEGVTEIVNRFGKIIVLEDDGVTARNFLTFMNGALDFYEKEDQIMHVATFTFIKMPNEYKKTFFWRYTENTGGGWGTWKNSWDKFEQFFSEEKALSALSLNQKNRIQLNGSFKCLTTLKLNPIPWDICWYIALIRNNGLSVNSPHALIKNNGLFNGTHFTIINRLLGKSPFEVELDKNEEIIFDDHIVENKNAIKLLKVFYEKMEKRKRAIILNKFIRILVVLKITKLLKKFFK
ncbi:MAG: sugar transferase [Candidatus Magasanikbacteria bacterium]|nr:sugar transferase [Candidatus Magasanikbacteria bacterium]